VNNHQILFDKLAFIDRLKRADFTEPQARAIGEALDEALRESVATKADMTALRTELRTDMTALRTDMTALEHKIELAVRDMTIRTGAMLVLLFSALAAIKFFG
jgi:hypothetical protein